MIEANILTKIILRCRVWWQSRSLISYNIQQLYEGMLIRNNTYKKEYANLNNT